jgi:ribosomal-protein-alanine N-acetyltransferase
MPPEETPAKPALVRAAQREDLPELAVLDIASFGPFWHMGEAELGELHFRGRMIVACSEDGAFVGYSALLNGTREEAHLARIAVHPEWQGKGVGRLLLQDTVEYCRAQGCRALGLNTQFSNLRSQALYRAAGFRESGLALPVYTLKLP